MYRRADDSTHLHAGRCFGDDLREKVLVAETSRSAQQHFCDGELRAVAYELRTDPTPLGRPDALGQPALQRQVVGKPAEQAHRRMCVGVDEAGNQRMRRPLHHAARLVQGRGRESRQDIDDASFADRHDMVFEDPAGRTNRDAPARRYQGVTVLHERAKYTHLWYAFAPVSRLSWPAAGPLWPARRLVGSPRTKLT